MRLQHVYRGSIVQSELYALTRLFFTDAVESKNVCFHSLSKKIIALIIRTAVDPVL